MKMQDKFLLRWFAGAFGALLVLAGAATPAGAALPAVKSLTGTPISPSSADTYYGTGTTHTAGLCGLNTIMCGLPRAAAIVALARTLSQGGTLTSDQFTANVYEYVYKNIDTEFRYGLSKGAFGALLDQSGTPFDQAHLMVELLKEGATDFPTNYSTLAPTYQAGTVTLSGTAFASWTGITNAQAACQYLANGGIPASVNGSTPTSCTSLSGSVSTIVMSHIWVQATTSVSVKLYDPSYKVYTQKPGIDIATAMGCGSYTASTCGATALSAALPTGTTGHDSTAQADYVQNVAYGALGTTLNGLAANLQHYIENPANNLQAAKVDDIVGGHEINPALMPSPAASLSYDPAPTVQHSWTGDIPDQYRSRLNVQFNTINVWVYADETSGYWLYVTTSYANSQNIVYTTLFFEREKGTAAPNSVGLSQYCYNGSTGCVSNLRPTNEPVLLASSTVNYSASAWSDPLTLQADHPYAANSGTYADDSLVSNYFGYGPPVTLPNAQNIFGYLFTGPGVYIVQSWGRTGTGTVSRMSTMAQDKKDAAIGSVRWVMGSALPIPTTSLGYLQDLLRNTSLPVIADTWLSEAGKATSLADGINNTRTQEQHTLGFIADIPTQQSLGLVPIGSFILTDAVGALNITSVTANSTDQQSAFNVEATAYDALEGSTLEQTNDTPDGGNAIRLFELSNEDGLRYYDATPANLSTVLSVTTGYESGSYECGPEGGIFGCGPASVGAYLSSTAPLFDVIVPQSNGWTMRSPDMPPYFKQYGASPLLAFATDDSALAYISTYGTKGAGATSPQADPIGSVIDTTTKTQPVKTFDIKIDGASGDLTAAVAPDLVTGSGAFPHSLSHQLFYNSKQIPGYQCFETTPSYTTPIGPGPNFSYLPYQTFVTFCETEPDRRTFLGWNDNFQINASFANDGMRGLGQDSGIDASAVIAALYVLRDFNKSPNFQNYIGTIFTAAWLEDNLGANAVVINRPPSADTFVRLPDGRFNPRPGAYASLTQTGARTKDFAGPGPIGNWAYYYTGIQLTETGSAGDILQFSLNDVRVGATSPSVNRFKPDSWTFADGTKLSFSYTQVADPLTAGTQSMYVLSGATNSLGRSLTFANGTVTDDSGRSASVSIAGPTSGQITKPDGGQILLSFDRYDNYSDVASTRLSAMFQPLDHVHPFLTFNWDGLRRASSVVDANSDTTTYYPASIGAQENVTRGAIVDALSNATMQYFDQFGKLLQATDPLGFVTSYTYDGIERLTQTTYPEGNFTTIDQYDARSNILQATVHPIPTSSLSPIVTSTTYMEGAAVYTCADPVTCNDPATKLDGNGILAKFNWNSTTGQLTSAITGFDSTGTTCLVKDALGVTVCPETDYGYTSYTANGATFSLLTSKTEKVSSTTSTKTVYAYNSANKYVLQTGIEDYGTGHLNLTTTLTFDGVGNVTQIQGPRTDLSTDIANITWDVDRRLTSSVEANPGNGKQPTTEYGYDLDGRLIAANKGYVNSSCSVDSFGLHFCDVDTLSDTYDAVGNKLKEEDLGSGSSPFSLTQYTYDKDERPTCTAERMNTAAYSALPASACTLSTTGPYGNDRIVENVYCVATNADCAWNKVRAEKRAFGTSLVENYAIYQFTPNGLELSVTDAVGHATIYAYDGFDRLAQTTFADSTVSQPDKELISAYDSDGNILTKVNRASETLTYTYDALDRMLTKAVPAAGSIPANTVTWGYDLINEKTSISDTLGNTLTNVYDLAKRETSASRIVPGLTGAQTIGYQYTDGVNRTRLTWPDTSYYVNYSYDSLNHILSASEQGLSYLANYGYDNVARRATLQYGVTAAEMSYSWSAQDDLLTLAHNFTGTTFDNTFTDTFVPSHQLATSTISNPSYILTPSAAGTDTYGATTSGGNANKLNQYPSFTPSGGTSAPLSYDKNGNMATDGAWTYVYDPENRLMTANMSGTSVAYTYDPLGRRTSKTVNGTSTFFLDDGDTEIGEYDGSGNLLRRYVPGPNIDEPIAMVTPPAGSNPEVIKYFHYDKIGSVVAMSDASGNIESGDGPYTYDVYGNMTGSTSGVPYRFTGQRLDPETGLYYYRARYYSPSLGRFLQVDPIGYGDDLDLYTYVGNDPEDGIDPQGQDMVVCNIVDNAFSGCEATRDNNPNTVVTYNFTTHVTDYRGNSYTWTQSTVPVEYLGRITDNPTFLEALTGTGARNDILSFISQTVSVITGHDTTVEADTSNDANANTSAAQTAAQAAASSGGRVPMRPGQAPNTQENANFRAAMREAEKNTGMKMSREQQRELHDRISGQGISYHDMVEEAKAVLRGE